MCWPLILLIAPCNRENAPERQLAVAAQESMKQLIAVASLSHASVAILPVLQ